MKILMIDDDPNVVETISLGLQVRWPEAELVSTSSGKKGIEMVRSCVPDAVILDLSLPDMSGFEVLKQVRSFCAVPVLILSVWGDEGYMVKGLELGANDYVVKPFSQMELLARMKSLTLR